MTELLKNRYDKVTPTHIQPNGCSISTPIYLTPTPDQNKALLNGFREVVRAQRIEMGFNPQPQSRIGVQVVTQETPPQTPAELELGMTEESLRYALFSRRGLAERLVIQLQQITGIQLVTREAIEDTVNAWLDTFEFNEDKGTQGTRKKGKTTKPRTKTTVPAS